MKKAKRILTFMLAMVMVLSVSSFTAFAADATSVESRLVNNFTGFRVDKVTITPLVVKNGSNYETKASNYATTTSYSRASHSNLAYWQT